MTSRLRWILLAGLAVLAACAAPRPPAPHLPTPHVPTPHVIAEPEIVPLTLEQDRDIGRVRQGS